MFIIKWLIILALGDWIKSQLRESTTGFPDASARGLVFPIAQTPDRRFI